ncbi:MAG: SPOR domain-containing protein [Flavobacteriaceae bacterium]|nr:MAG: SPOR domain-containing protein [Flavobacteriaceae bacterium]
MILNKLYFQYIKTQVVIFVISIVTMKRKPFYFVVFALLFFGIATGYSQDSIDRNHFIQKLIQKKREYNKTHGLGYRIQLYNGLEVRVKRTQAKFKAKFPNIKTYVTYVSPEWKIQVGNYKTRLEADRALLAIKDSFSGAIVVPIGR